MARIKLDLPSKFIFSTQIVVRVRDLNYGNHLSNDMYLSYMHEARIQFFASMGFTEMNLAGASVIMGDTAIVFKQECFYNDALEINVTVGDIGMRSFDIYYQFLKVRDGSLVCEAKTGMVCFNYDTRKTENVPNDFILLVNHR